MTELATERAVVSAQIPQEQRDELERRAAENDRTISAELRIALRHYLDERVPVDKSEEPEEE